MWVRLSSLALTTSALTIVYFQTAQSPGRNRGFVFATASEADACA